ncbi:MAG: transposase [Candidatus Heimdallarchaeota archaeon]|nr:transposase [Candidatus Heimdallarchaeota archaeon]
MKKLATAVVCQNYKQLSRPFYINQIPQQYRHIERLYKHITGIQTQLTKEPENTKLQIEQTRLHKKINHIRQELAHHTANTIIKIAEDWECKRILFEDLRHFKPQRNRKWSRKLSDWLRGKIPELVEQRSSQKGLIVKKVLAWGTSTYCPRCTAKGEKILAPNNHKQTNKGRWFICPNCHYSAERDYIAALNIYRASFIDYKTIKSLTQTSPVPYMDTGIPPPNRSWRGTRYEPTQIVQVTGG